MGKSIQCGQTVLKMKGKTSLSIQTMILHHAQDRKTNQMVFPETMVYYLKTVEKNIWDTQGQK